MSWGRWARRPGALLVAWGLSRVLLVLIATDSVPYPDADLLINDVRLYAEWSELLASGQFPVGDETWQYPPLAGVVFVLARYAATDPVTGFLVLAALADLAVLLLLLARGRRVDRPQAAWAWVLGGVLVGPVTLGRFDVFPTLAAVVALLWIGRPVRAGAAVGVGVLLKVWPGLLLLAAPRRVLGPAAAVAAVTVAAGWAVLALWADGTGAFLAEQGDRGLQVESVGALPYLVAGAFGPVVIAQEFRYGAQEIAMAGAEAVGLTLTLLGLLMYAVVLVQRLRGRLERVPPADVALAVVLVSIVTSRVISPQYGVWVAGIAAVCLLDPATRMRRALWLLAGSALLGQVIYPFAYGSMQDGTPPAVAVQVVRLGLLLAGTVLAVTAVLRPERSDDPVPALVSPPDRSR
ncbi:MAG: glycosyltransferase 87 family protein [Candidatus Nanopelagicales bacterium]